MATARRSRVRRVRVVCPRCGEGTWVQVTPLTYARHRGDRPALVVLTVSCRRHCGADVPITAGDVHRAA